MPNIDELLEREQSEIAPVYKGARTTVEYEELEDSDSQAIETCVADQHDVLKKTSPEIAENFAKHLPFFKKFGGVARAMMDKKHISYPSTEGNIGVAALFPQAITYVASPTSGDPAYTSYSTNLWELSLTAGTAGYFLGDGSNFFKAQDDKNKRELIVIIKDGVIEIGTTPRLQQMRLYDDGFSKYGIWATQVLREVPIERGLTVYQYNTLGVLPVYYDHGVMFGYMPAYGGTSKVPLLGLVFYEHGLFPDLTWVT